MSGTLEAPCRATWHDVLDSTNDEARRLAALGAPHGTVVAAIRQTGGRGRHGRRWTSLAGNLHASFLLRPAPPPPQIPELGFAAALAVAETIESYLPPGIAVGLKWPNDALVRGRKIAGILVEAGSDATHGSWAVLGIGINLAAAPRDPSPPAEALASFIAPPAPAEALSTLTDRLRRWLARRAADGFGPLAAAWRARGPQPGTTLRIRMADALCEGTFAGLGPNGELLLATPGGTRIVSAGEVVDQTPP